MIQKSDEIFRLRSIRNSESIPDSNSAVTDSQNSSSEKTGMIQQSFQASHNPTPDFSRPKQVTPEIDIIISPTATRKGISFSRHSMNILFITIGIIIVISLLGFGYKTFFNPVFYNGIWNGVISDSEKASGVQELIFEIKEGKLYETVRTETSGLSTKAQVSSKINIVEESSSSLTFRKEELEITDISMEVPSILCQQANTTCDEVKSEFISIFREQITKQNEIVKDTSYTISKINNQQLTLQSPEGTRILQRESK